MVNYQSPEQLDTTFHALADPTRRAILAHLTVGEAKVTDIASQFESSLPNISKHLRVLENAGLIQRRKAGRVHWFTLVADPMKDAMDWLRLYRKFWDASFDALADLVEDEDDQ